MDGELDNHEAELIIATLKKEGDLRDDWEAFHLIGDTLRRSTKLSTNISQSVSTKLATEEPTVLEFNQSKHRKSKVFSFAIAASVIAMATTWLSLQSIYQPQQTIVADQSNTERNIPAGPIIVSTPPVVHAHRLDPAEMNDYLFVHGALLPGTTSNGLINYVHPVTSSQESYGR